MWTQAEREALNRPQRRVVDALVAADRPRPPAGQRLVVSKSALDALDCDGRFVDRGDGQFAWSPAMVRGERGRRAGGRGPRGDRQCGPRGATDLRPPAARRVAPVAGPGTQLCGFARDCATKAAADAEHAARSGDRRPP